MGEFWRYRSTDRSLYKLEGDDYFTHQRIVRRYMVYNDRLLLIHDAGTGKTRTALGLAGEIVGGVLYNIYRRVVIATPSEKLHDAWRSNPEIAELAGAGVTVEFVTHYGLSTLDPSSYGGTVFIVDEVHRMANEGVALGFDSNAPLRNSRGIMTNDAIYQGVWGVLHRSRHPKVLLLTATPMQNSQRDFYPLINLILPEEDQITGYRDAPVGDELLNLIAGRVSYVRAAEEGVAVSHDVGEEMLTSIATAQLTDSVGAIPVLSLFSPKVGERRALHLPPRGEFPLDHFMLELVDERGESRGFVGLLRGSSEILFRSAEVGDMEFDVTVSESGYITPTRLPSGEKLRFDLSATSLCNHRTVHGTVMTETILGPSQSLSFVRKIEENQRSPLEGQRLAVFNYKVNVNIEADALPPARLFLLSGLLYTAVSIFLRTLPREARGGISEEWLSHIGEDVVEVGKNIFYNDLVEVAGGINTMETILVGLGYERLPRTVRSFDDLRALGKRARLVTNPKEREIELFNHPENWDGSYIHLSIYSSQGAAGFSYKDVRHIHRLPHWSPAENTQALFRGIRAKSHEELRRHVDDLVVRVYTHVGTPSPEYINYNNVWLRDGVFVPETGLRYLGGEAFVRNLQPPASAYPTDVVPLATAERLDAEVNTPGMVLQREGGLPVVDVGWTMRGIALERFPNPSAHPTMDIANNQLRNPPREGFADELATTFYSPVAYRYFVATEKDMAMAEIKRLYKVAAMDCDLNHPRNVLPSTMDGTEQCDYGACDFVCLPDARGLEIVMHTVDPRTGEDIRDDRTPWTPMTNPRLSTWESYQRTTADIRNRVYQRIVDLFAAQPLGFLSIYTAIVRLGDLGLTETEIMDTITEFIYKPRGRETFLDWFGNPCYLRIQGSLLYLLPIYESEQKLLVTPEGQHMARLAHGPRARLHAAHAAWSRFIAPPLSRDSLVAAFRDFERTHGPEDVVAQLFSFAAVDFPRFVSLVEGSFLTETPLRAFTKYRFETTLDVIDKIELKRDGAKKRIFVPPGISPWNVDEASKRTRRVVFHFLDHMSPAHTGVRKILSEKAVARFAVEGYEDIGFIDASDVERDILYEIASERMKRDLEALASSSPFARKIVGIIDERSYIFRTDEESMDYFKLYEKRTGGARDPQGQVCRTKQLKELREIAAAIEAPSPTCRSIYDTLTRRGLVW